jgi:hypothetical protein
MSSRRTPEEQAFLDYFGAIDKRAIGRILADYRSTGPRGYATSLVLARILKVRERISSDRELAEKLACIRIYRQAIGIGRREVPAHNTFHTLRQRLGTEGFVRLHRHFVLQAWKTGLLTPPVPRLPKLVRDKIILLGDSTFLKAVTRTKCEKDEAGNWLFRDDSVAFGKPHHKHKYPVGHRAHTLTCVSGVPLVSLLAPANESDQVHILPLLAAARRRYPELPFASIILDAGYDAEDLHRDIYTEYALLPIIIRKPTMKWGPHLCDTGTPPCPFGYPTRRRGIEYAHRRTKFACHHACRRSRQPLLFRCEHVNSRSPFGWMTYTYFEDDYRRQGPAVPGSRVYERLRKLRTGIERYYALTHSCPKRDSATGPRSGVECVLKYSAFSALERRNSPSVEAALWYAVEACFRKCFGWSIGMISLGRSVGTTPNEGRRDFGAGTSWWRCSSATWRGRTRCGRSAGDWPRLWASWCTWA